MADNPRTVKRIAEKYATTPTIADLFKQIISNDAQPYEVRDELQDIINENELKREAIIQRSAHGNGAQVLTSYIDTLYDASTDANYLIGIKNCHCPHCGNARDYEDTSACNRCKKNGFCFC